MRPDQYHFHQAGHGKARFLQGQRITRRIHFSGGRIFPVAFSPFLFCGLLLISAAVSHAASTGNAVSDRTAGTAIETFNTIAWIGIALLFSLLVWIFTLKREVNIRTAALRESEARSRADQARSEAAREAAQQQMAAMKRVEQALQDSEKKYRELVEHANSIILRWSSEGVITFLNDFGLRFFGYTAEDIFGRHVMGTIVPESESSGRDLKQLMKQICSDPAGFEQSVNENVRRNGERVWISWTNRVVLDSRGEVLEILSVGTDITERKRASEALRQSEEQFRLIMENLADLVAVLDLNGRRLYNSPSYQRILGEPRKLLGSSSFEQVHPDDRARVELVFQETVRSGIGQRMEYRMIDQNGQVRHIESQGSVICDSQGRVSKVVVVSRDVTERRKAEEEIRQMNVKLEKRVLERTAELAVARDRAEESDRLKSAFLATMSHELRTPLNSVIGFTGIMLQGLAGPLNEEQTKQLKMVQGSARHLLALINDVLDISKIEAGQVEIHRTEFDLHEACQHVMQTVLPLAKKKGLQLQFDGAETAGRFTSDRRRFEQVLLNLLSNAIKFTESGSVMLRVRFVLNSPSQLHVAVTDTGMGIKPEDLPILFQPFRQIDTGLTRRHEGTGLGLAICKRLVERLGGNIRVESEWGRGSTFSFTLPVSPEGNS